MENKGRNTMHSTIYNELCGMKMSILVIMKQYDLFFFEIIIYGPLKL